MGIIKFILNGVTPARIITFALTGVIVYLWLEQTAIPETLKTSWLIIIGFWFDSELKR